LLVVGLLVLMLLQSTGHLQPVKGVISDLVAPVQYTFTWASTRVANITQAFREFSSLQAQVRELQDTIDRLMIENVRLREAEIELATLREQLNFKLANPTYELLAAEVIGHDPSNLLHYIIIDRGAEDGLAVGMPVVTARGLVGRVISVYPHSARAMLLTDPASAVSTLIQSSRASGLVRGQGHRGLTMHYVEQREQVQEGDVVLTSGLGGNFPKRLVVGQVTSVRHSDVEMFLEIEVQSAVYFDRLEMVLVIQSFAPVDYHP
jgi:rod shape-determining protein MreC